MSDREKVLNDLQELCEYLFHEYNVCYKGDEEDTYNRFLAANNALNLLKEQPEQKHGHWIEYPKCLEYDGALDDTYIVCSACEHVFNVIDNCTELFDYCPKCGAKMNEENEKEK